MEDKQVDWKKNKSPGETKDERKSKKGKDFDLTPVYDPPSFSFRTLFNPLEKLNNAIGGATIALHDIWATEVKITKYKLEGGKYEGKYQVTLWDHFGLDLDDIRIDKFAGKSRGFITWFLLQHFRGYKPFITKITFEEKFSGDLKDEIN